MTTHSYWKAGALAMVATGLAVGVMSMPTAATAQEIGNDVPAGVCYFRQIQQAHPVEVATRDIKTTSYLILRQQCTESSTDSFGSLRIGPVARSRLVISPAVFLVYAFKNLSHLDSPTYLSDDLCLEAVRTNSELGKICVSRLLLVAYTLSAHRNSACR